MRPACGQMQGPGWSLGGEGHGQICGGSLAVMVRSHKKNKKPHKIYICKCINCQKLLLPDMFLLQSLLQPWAELDQGRWTRGAGHTEHGRRVCGVTSIPSSCCTSWAQVGLLGCRGKGWGVRGAAVPAGDRPRAPLPGWTLLFVCISIARIYQAAIAMVTLKMVLFQAS